MTSPLTASASLQVTPAVSTRRSAPRVLARIAALIAVSALLVMGPVSTAAAHDELASSSPADEATIDVAPGEIVLTFSNPPSGIGAEIIVADSSGTSWSEGPPTVVNNTAIQPLRSGAPAGTYTVQWRVVSADDHPIEGTLSFTSTSDQAQTPGTGPAGIEPTAGLPVTDAPSDLESAAQPGSDTGASQGSSESAGPEAVSPQVSNPASSAGLPTFVIYLGLGGFLIAVLLALVTLRNLRKK